MTTDRVGPDMVVSVTYRLFDAEGEQVDETSEPLTFVSGYAQVIPALERGLAGAKAGETRRVEASPDEAFGERDPEAIIEVDARDFPGAEVAAPGDEVEAESSDGDVITFRVVEVGSDSILIDRNHPLAGQDVRFDVEVVAVRPATDEELDAAMAEADEHIAYESTIVYGNPSPEPPSELIQLRRSADDRKPHE